MADVAAAAGVSRPALYQYFDGRSDLFRACFEAVLEDTTDAALAALDDGVTLADRLDGYLQRAFADGYESLASTPFGLELMEARHEFADDVAAAATDRARRGLQSFVRSVAGMDARKSGLVLDMLSLAPSGLKSDEPSVALYRRRLRALATMVAAQLEAG